MGIFSDMDANVQYAWKGFSRRKLDGFSLKHFYLFSIRTLIAASSIRDFKAFEQKIKKRKTNRKNVIYSSY